MATLRNLRIDRKRLERDLHDLSKIGLDASRGPGLFRTAFSKHDVAGRTWLINTAIQANLAVFVDAAGNIHLRLRGTPSSPAAPDMDVAALYRQGKQGVIPPEFSTKAGLVMCGSHLDSVPGGGHLDGHYGVLAGLEVLRTLRDHNVQLPVPVEVVSFTDEEGHFGTLVGSRCLAGTLSLEEAQTAANPQGWPLSDAMESVGLDVGSAVSKVSPHYSRRQVHAYLELHIEQGPVLAQHKESVAVVSGIVGLWKAELCFKGQANHAGTTPMHMRRDALQGAMELKLFLPTLLQRYGAEHSVATLGHIELFPGAPNVVPGKCSFTLDVRDSSVVVLEKLSKAIVARAKEIAAQHQLEFDYAVLSSVRPALCSTHVMDTVQSCATALQGQPVRVMPSGALHDAQVIAGITAMGMIFVPSRGGLSHTPEEFTSMEDLEVGANVLLHSLMALSFRASKKGGIEDDGRRASTTVHRAVKGPVQSTMADAPVLLCVDLQQSLQPALAVPSRASVSKRGIQEYYARALPQCLQHVRTLQNHFRAKRWEVIHCRVQSLTLDGRDRGYAHRRLGLHNPPNSTGAQFFTTVQPRGDEIVLNKTASGVFSSTNLHYLLANLGARTLVVCGAFTHECVSNAVRSASDLGYQVVVVGSACLAPTSWLQEEALAQLGSYATLVHSPDDLNEFLVKTHAASPMGAAAKPLVRSRL